MGLPDWFKKGFSQPPVPDLATGMELLYRVQSGSGGIGNWFTMSKMRSAGDAELKLNIALWGNKALVLATYVPYSGVKMWIGPVWHGGNDVCIPNMIQIYIKDEDLTNVSLIREEALSQDCFMSHKTYDDGVPGKKRR